MICVCVSMCSDFQNFRFFLTDLIDEQLSGWRTVCSSMCRCRLVEIIPCIVLIVCDANIYCSFS